MACESRPDQEPQQPDSEDVQQSVVRNWLPLGGLRTLSTHLHFSTATTFYLLSRIPATLAAYEVDIPAVPTQYLMPLPTNLMNSDAATAIRYSVGNETGLFNLPLWAQRGMLVRQGGQDLWCLGNLSWAIMNVGALNAGEYSGAAGTLALLPTAGALIGAPTKELWLIYKLMPIAGVLTMFLSLGGTIMPSSVGDYDLDTLNYGGMIATDRKRKRTKTKGDDEADYQYLSEPQRFGRRVSRRAEELAGGNGYLRIWIATFGQLVFLGAILIVLWYGQRGSVIPWWCRVWGWMYFWLFLVIIVSILENLTSSPFSESYTMRVSRAPSNIEISDDTPYICRLREDPEQGRGIVSHHLDRDTNGSTAPSSILDRLKQGINSTSQIVIFSGDAYSKPKTCFYVVISKEGVTHTHAALKMFAKGASLAVYAFGTALFAAAQLMSISVALMILSVVLGSATFGRINGMFIASEMNKTNEPILHAVIKGDENAADYIEGVLAEAGLVVELLGHVIVDGRVVTRRNELFNWATYIGLLAPPFDLQKIAVPSQHALSRKQTWQTFQGEFGTSESYKNAPEIVEFARNS